jgi:WD40 repeat protein
MPRLIRSRPNVQLEGQGILRLQDYVHRAAFSPDGRNLAACSASGQVVTWHIPGRARACAFKGHDGWAFALAWDRRSSLLASGGRDGMVRIWDVATGEERAALPVGTRGDWIEHLSWDRRTDRLAASAGKTVQVWSCGEDGSFLHGAEIASHTTTVSALAWMPPGGGLLSACYGGASLWRIGEEKPVRTFPYAGAMLSIAVTPDGQYLASGNLDSSVHLFKTANEQNWHMSGYPVKVRAVAFDQTGLNLWTVSGPSLIAWNMKQFEGSSGRLFKGHLGWIQDMSCHPTLPVVATVGEDGLLCLWDAGTTKPRASQEVNKNGGLSCVAWSPDGTRLVTGATDGTLSLFRVEGLK